MILSEAMNQGISSLPGLVGLNMGVEMKGDSFAAASGMVITLDLMPATVSFTRGELPLRVTSQVNVSFLPKRL